MRLLPALSLALSASIFAFPASAQTPPESQPAPAAPAPPLPAPEGQSAPTPPAPPPPPPESPSPAAPPSVVPRPVAPAPEAAAHEEAPAANSGFQASFTLGVAMPLGKATGDVAMGDVINTGLALQFALGGKIGEHVYIGVYAGGVGASAGPSSPCSKCGAGSGQLGIEGRYFFAPASAYDPWVGYGIGYETTGYDIDNGKLEFRGGEFARLSGGVDYRTAKWFGLGPALTLSVAKYTSGAVTEGGTERSFDIVSTGIHAWATLGLRLVLFP